MIWTPTEVFSFPDSTTGCSLQMLHNVNTWGDGILNFLSEQMGVVGTAVNSVYQSFILDNYNNMPPYSVLLAVGLQQQEIWLNIIIPPPIFLDCFYLF